MKMMIAALMLVSTSALANSGSGPKFDEIPRIQGSTCSYDRSLLLGKDGTLIQECAVEEICTERVFVNYRGFETVKAKCEVRTKENGGL
ncbi:hypothetical protein [Bdellovibrio sp. KM01]|uniref:hypothetical protein n=1 Tax=Bdellovibrio sp. KM01 TaxID=2748865 RepID=UPI0015E976E7|nr:hypothetical protein [Bdellovibrio sp. KM01]QLY25751.1 hypothetical protein HW988_01490 [Bdellovibrio sp. KM01]